MTLYLSLGSNISPRHHYIDQACLLIEQQVGTVLRRSKDFLSEPWGYESTHEYLNIALAVSTTLTPMEVLKKTQDIERELGRTIKNHYQDRTIDIDILLCYDQDDTPIRIDEALLTIPHPLMTQRDFVMKPLEEILCHPLPTCPPLSSPDTHPSTLKKY